MTVGRSLIAILLVATCLDRARAESLGRLFHSAAERSALDALRKEKSKPQKPAPPLPAESPAPRLDGYVVRSDGSSTQWVNGRAVTGAR